MTDETDDCEISLKLSKKSISSYVCTLDVPNFFTLPKYDDENVSFTINSPSFEFSEATWRFQFDPRKYKNSSGNLIKSFSVYIERTHSEINEHMVFIRTVLLDSNDKKYAGDYDSVEICENDEPYYVEEFNDENPSHDTRDTLNLTIYLIDRESFVEDTDHVFTIERRINRLSKNFKQFFLDGRLTDAVLKVDSREFNVHKIILAACSPVFASMFEHDLTENNTNMVEIPDCTAESFGIFLHFLYSGSAETLSISNVYNVYYTADKYYIDDLKEECVEFMKKNLSVDAFFDVFSLSLLHGESKLQETAIDFFCENATTIFETMQWENYMREETAQAHELVKTLKEHL